MANPTKYTPGYSYSGFQGANPTKPLPAPRVDDDFANISRSINEAIAALADVRRSDGRLQNGSVGPDTLSPTLKIGFTFRGLWIQGEKYVAGDGVVHEGVFYSASRANTATEQNAPGDDTYWTELFSVDDLVVSGALSMPVNRFTGDGTQVEFELDFTPVTAKNLLITIGGAPQETTQYATVGNKLTFNEPPPEGYSIEVRGFATLAVSDTIVSDTIIEGVTNLFMTPSERANVASSLQAVNIIKRRKALYLTDLPEAANLIACQAQGQGTDIGPAFRAGMAKLLSEVGHGSRIILPEEKVRVATASSIDLMGFRDVEIECRGILTTDNVAMTALAFRNARDMRLQISLDEGGKFTPSSNPDALANAIEAYGVNYSTTADAAGAGGQVAVLLQGIFNCEFDVRAYAYAGRAIQIGAKINSTHPQSGAFKGRITSVRNSSDLSKPSGGQSLWADNGGAFPTEGNFGHIERLSVDFDCWGPVHRDWNDTAITEMDTAFHFTGPSVEGCVVFEIDNGYVGTISNLGTGSHFVVKPSASRNSGEFRASKLRLNDFGNGLLLKDVQKAKIGFLEGGGVGALTLCHVDNSRNVDVLAATLEKGETLFKVTGGNADKISLRGRTEGEITGDHVVIGSDVNGAVSLNVGLTNAKAGKSLIKVDGAALVQVTSSVLYSDLGNIFDLASGNQVNVVGGSVAGAAGAYKTAFEVQSVTGVKGLSQKVAYDTLPDADATRSLGSTARRFLSGFFRNLIIGGNGELNAKIDINGASSRFRVLGFLTNTASRVLMGISDAAESSVATGSDFFIKVYNNAGAYVADAITIARTTGKTTFNTRPGIAGVGDVWATAAADVSKAANGFEKLPNGMIKQWGIASGAAGDLAVTFSTAFPTACTNVQCTMVDTGIASTSLLAASVKIIGVAGFTVERRFCTAGTVGAAAESVYWEATGY